MPPLGVNNGDSPLIYRPPHGKASGKLRLSRRAHANGATRDISAVSFRAVPLSYEQLPMSRARRETGSAAESLQGCKAEGRG